MTDAAQLKNQAKLLNVKDKMEFYGQYSAHTPLSREHTLYAMFDILETCVYQVRTDHKTKAEIDAPLLIHNSLQFTGLATTAYDNLLGEKGLAKTLLV